MSGTSISTQERNSAQVALLTPEFVTRSEPNYAWKSAVSAYLALPGLRGFWPMSSVAYTNPQGLDVSGNANHLTNNNSSDFGYENLIPYVDFNGTTEYLSKADGGAGNWADVRGNEVYIDGNAQGLTIYAWVKFDDEVPASAEVIVGKNNAGGLAYWLIRRANGQIRFSVDSGAGIINVDSVFAVGAGVWTFCAGRFIPSTSISVFLNRNCVDNVAAIPATIQDTTAPLTVGADGVPSLYLDGKESMIALCAAQHSNSIVKAVHNQTRSMFNRV